MAKIKLNRNELMEVLGVKTEGLKSIEKRGQLEERLNEKGYDFVEKIKEGRSNMYIVDKQENGDDRELLTNIIKNIYKTKEYLTFSEYYTIRYVFAKMEWQGATSENIAEYVGVHINTISKWDSMLKENGVIQQNGYYYYKRDLETGEETQTDKWEYKSYWQNKKDISAMKSLQKKYDSGLITFNELRVALAEHEDYKRAVEGKYCFRVKKYIINEINVLNKDIFNLIKKSFLTDIGLEYLKIKR